MAVQGTLREASVAELLQLLCLARKSGALLITDRNQRGRIFFQQGRICYASVVNRRDRLGDLLVKAGKISQDQLDAAVALQERQRDVRVGELLIGHGAISREEVERQIRRQIEEAVCLMCTWSRGSFQFEPDARPDPEDVLVSLSPESLLLEAARRVDEWGLVEHELPTPDLIFAVDRDRIRETGVELAPEQERLLAFLDGRRNLGRVMEDSGLGDLLVHRALYGLITAGFARPVGRSRKSVDLTLEEARLQEHRNLGRAFLKVGMLEEAQREFQLVLGRHESDGEAAFCLGLIAVKKWRWSEAVRCFRQAAERLGGLPAVLHNLGYAYDGAGDAKRAEAAYAEAAIRAVADSRPSGRPARAAHWGESAIGGRPSQPELRTSGSAAVLDAPPERNSSRRPRTSGIAMSPRRGYLHPDKVVWQWPDPAERLIEDLD